MRIISAIDNEILEERLKLKYEDSASIICVKSKDEILNELSKLDNTSDDIVIILRLDLKGSIDVFELVDKVNNLRFKTRFILIVQRLENLLKERLFAKEIFNIIEGDSFLFEDLISSIENPKQIIYKNDKKKSNNCKKIIITGSHSSGKSTLARILSLEIAKNKAKKVLVLDLDFIYPSLDLYLDGTSKNYSLGDLLEDGKKNEFKKVSSYETSRGNIKYVLNSKVIDVPSVSVLSRVISYLEEYYDYIIIDSSASNISHMINLSKEVDGNLVITLGMDLESIRNFKTDFENVSKDDLSLAMLVVTRYKKKSGLEEYIKKHVPLVIFGRVKSIKKYNVYKLLKSIGILRFENIKLKLIEKIMNIGEEK